MIKQALAISVFAAGVLLAGGAMANTQGAAMQHQAMPAMHQANRGTEHGMNVGDMYTAALNTLYAHGYHGVSHLWMKNGAVAATATTPEGQPRHVTVQPGTGQVQVG